MDVDFSHLGTSYSWIGSSFHHLKVSIDVVKWLVFQGCAFRRRDEALIQEIKDTTSLALEKTICELLLHHCLNVDDIRGQGYNGASNMHGEWNGLQALFSEKDIEASHIAKLIGKGKNQVGTLERPGNTRWGSHLAFLNSLMRMFDSIYVRDNLTIEHHYRFDIFIAGIDSLLTKMNSRFNDKVVDLFVLSSALDPLDNYKAFWNYSSCANSSVSTATIERAFSAMKIVKTRLRNRMKDDFLSTYLVTYIEKEIAREFSIDSIIDELDLMKKRKMQFRIPSIKK
ncbi:hypothetical protein CXB51_002976 [Gossypium anomalum]|uniref:HAT C-terminal dimerisation domain-containing protein n=1 Tax=Gossypium anomalum TaxID=47600 RepID=A0A8J5Z1L5_9ROSI|nr:hypothetical protein CXB51_002976 [Gossypium anomalum]